MEGKSTHAKSRFTGRVAFITGGAGDFGSKCAERFIEEGGSAAILDMAAEKLEEVAKKLNEKNPGKALAIPCDVTSEEAVAEAVKKTEDTFGVIHYLFNNAGYQGSFSKMD